jgi:hypothetical protein
MLERAKKAVVAIAFLALFGFLAFQSGIATNNNPRKQPAESSTTNDHESKNPFERLWEWTTHDPVAFYTSVLAIFTGILGASTVALWWSTRRLVRSAEDTSMRQLRAYVGVDNMLLRQVAAGEKPKMTIRTKNFGQTPAYKLTRWSTFVIAETPPTRASVQPKEWSGKMVMDPGAIILTIQERDDALTTEEFATLSDGSKRLYWIGRIVYRDAFGRRQVTDSLFEAVPPFDKGSPNPKDSRNRQSSDRKLRPMPPGYASR